MGSFGSPFSSESRTSTTTTTQNAGFSEVGGQALSINLTGGGKKSSQATTVNILDAGAIDKAFTFAGQAQAGALRQVELAGNTTAQTVREAVAAVSESGRTETENLAQAAMRWGTYALLGYAALRLFGHWKG